MVPAGQMKCETNNIFAMATIQPYLGSYLSCLPTPHWAARLSPTLLLQRHITPPVPKPLKILSDQVDAGFDLCYSRDRFRVPTERGS